jgi:uncharacterized membrane protein YtjA (UPF0391 family)
MAISQVDNSAEDGPIYHIPIGPPPPPRVYLLISLILALIAAILGFLGFGPYAGIAASGSFLFGAVNFYRTLNTVNVSTNVIDRSGRLNMKNVQKGS